MVYASFLASAEIRTVRGLIKKQDCGRSAFEAMLIVFSVLLALFFDSVIEEKREARKTDELVSHIIDEMKNNLTIVGEWLPYHRAVVIVALEAVQSTADGTSF